MYKRQLHTLPENSPCPTYIDLIEPRTGPGGDGDDTSAVNYTGTAVGIREEVCQRVFRIHITDDGMDFFGEQIDIGAVSYTHLPLTPSIETSTLVIYLLSWPF